MEDTKNKKEDSDWVQLYGVNVLSFVFVHSSMHVSPRRCPAIGQPSTYLAKSTQVHSGKQINVDGSF